MSSLTVGDYQYEIGARLARGDWAGAEAAAAGCRVSWPADSAGWLLGSMAALFADHKEEALALVEARLAVDPSDVQCLIQKAECLFALGNRDRSIAAAEAAATYATGSPEALEAIGVFMSFAADYRRAVSAFDAAILAAPNNASTLVKRGAAHQYLGHFDLAIRDYEMALAVAPQDAETLKSLTELRRQTAERNTVGDLEAALVGKPEDSQEAAALHFGLAKSYEDMGDYPSSWRHLTTANRLERRRLKYEPHEDHASIERIMAGFSETEIRLADSTNERPIFILGLPRTGTTLVERILGSHSAVHSSGESSALADAVFNVSFGNSPESSASVLGFVDSWNRLDAAQIAREYLSRIRARRGVRPRFSDKTPLNFFYCPLIFRAFPDACVVHLTRHPMAACYAIYKMRFSGGFPFSYDLTELADFYVDYRRMMAQWHRILPGRIHNVAYEDVVSAQISTTRRLLEYAELDFEAACLEFHLNPSATATASAVQVRQPLYDTSLDQWRHYAAELAPVRERLVAAGISVPE